MRWLVEVLAVMMYRLAPALRLLSVQLVVFLAAHQCHRAALARTNLEGRLRCSQNGVPFVGLLRRLGSRWFLHAALALLRVPTAVHLHHSGLTPRQVQLLRARLRGGTRRHGE